MPADSRSEVGMSAVSRSVVAVTTRMTFLKAVGHKWQLGVTICTCRDQRTIEIDIW